LLQAIDNRDIPVIEGIVFVFALIVVLSNLAADVLYSVLDPRIRYGRPTE
jgi:peptide/nickel transport system permease protein